jgi:hypothetical protein
MSNSNQALKQNNEENLKLVERFGFKFFGYDENSFTLVVAPNGQIVPLNVAYEFVQTQIANSQTFSGGGIEGMPNMPTMPIIPDSKIESKVESAIENRVEKKQETSNDNSKQNQQTVSVAPKQDPVKKTEPESPYGDGFKPPINPVYIEKALEYIKRNSKKSLSSTSKWLSVQFEKFISEQNSSK